MADKQEEEKKAADANKDWAEMSDGEAEEAEQEDKDKEQKEKMHVVKEKKVKPPPAKKGRKNQQGDYIVDKIEIEDNRVGMKKKAEDGEEDESDSDDTDYGNEDDAQDQAKDAPAETKEGK